MASKKIISLDKLQSLMTQMKKIFATKDELFTLKGPDDRLYKLFINEDFRLVLEEYINSRYVEYMRIGLEYYCLVEEIDGVYLSKLETELPNNARVGVLRTISKDNGDKYEIGVENNGIVFNRYDGPSNDEEAKYLICINNPNKAYYFKIKDNTVYLETTIVETVAANIK